MQILEKITEVEFILLFLQTEWTSARFGQVISQQLEANHQSSQIIEQPNTDSPSENDYRRQLLGQVRGYGQNQDLFENFPADISWHKAILSPEDIDRAMYINWDYWNQLTQHSRLVKDGAARIQQGVTIYDVANDHFWAAAAALKAGTTFKPLIFVAQDPLARLVVLEGHLRLTAYFLANVLPEPFEVVIGFSPDLLQWDMY